MRGAIFSRAECSATSRWRRGCRQHPLRGIKALLDEALGGHDRDFERVYAKKDVPRSRRSAWCAPRRCRFCTRSAANGCWCEQLDYNLLFRWFVGLSVDEPVWDHSSFTKNRDRLIEARVARKLLRRVGAQGARRRSCSRMSTSASMAR